MTDQELLNSARAALGGILSGGMASYTTPAGVTFTRLNIDQLRVLVGELEGRVAVAELSGAGGPSRIEIGVHGPYIDGGGGCR